MKQRRLRPQGGGRDAASQQRGMDAPFADRPSSFNKRDGDWRQRGSFLWVLSLAVQRKYLATAAKPRAKAFNKRKKYNVESGEAACEIFLN